MARIMYCEHCGSVISEGEKYCANCGAPAPMSIPVRPPNSKENQPPIQQTPVYPQPIPVNPPPPQPTYNGLANASFIVGLVSLILCWVPVLDICLLIAAMVISIIALVKIKNAKNNWKPITALVCVGVSFAISLCTVL